MSNAHETFSTILVRQHYGVIGFDRRWTRDDVNRLCQMLNCTPYELGELCRVSIPVMTRRMAMNSFPPELELHFARLKQAYLETVMGVKAVNTLPVDLLFQGRHVA